MQVSLEQEIIRPSLEGRRAFNAQHSQTQALFRSIVLQSMLPKVVAQSHATCQAQEEKEVSEDLKCVAETLQGLYVIISERDKHHEQVMNTMHAKMLGLSAALDAKTAKKV